MSEELIKRLRTVARDEERAWGDEDEVVILLREAADALSRPAPVQVPAGWKLVPAEPTQDMLLRSGLYDANKLAVDPDRSLARAIYRAMLAAAPSAPVAVASGCNRCGVAHHPKDCPATPSAPVAREEGIGGVWNNSAGPQAAAAPVQVPDVDWQSRNDALFMALELCSAELFAQCADQKRAMNYVERARRALAQEQCFRASIGLAAAAHEAGAHGVDVEKVMALVKQYAIAYHYRATGLHAHGMDEAHAAVESAIRALLSAIPAASGWQPIETAPRDGSVFIATGFNYGKSSEPRHYCMALWEQGEWREASEWNGHSSLAYLTHWQPLPPPPPAIANHREVE